MRTSAWCRMRNAGTNLFGISVQFWTCTANKHGPKCRKRTNVQHWAAKRMTRDLAMEKQTRCSMQRCWSSNKSHLALSKMAIIRPPLLVTVSGNLSERVRGRDTLCQRKWSMSSQICLIPRLMKSGSDRQFPKSTAAIMAKYTLKTIWQHTIDCDVAHIKN